MRMTETPRSHKYSTRNTCNQHKYCFNSTKLYLPYCTLLNLSQFTTIRQFITCLTACNQRRIIGKLISVFTTFIVKTTEPASQPLGLHHNPRACITTHRHSSSPLGLHTPLCSCTTACCAVMDSREIDPSVGPPTEITAGLALLYTVAAVHCCCCTLSLLYTAVAVHCGYCILRLLCIDTAVHCHCCTLTLLYTDTAIN